MVRGPDLCRVSGAVDQGFSVGGSHADGQLLQRAAEAAHGVPLKVGQHQHGIIVFKILAHMVLFDNLSVRDGQDQIGALGVQQIHGKAAAPAVLHEKPEVLVGGVPLPVVGGVALHNGAAHMLDDGLPEFRPEKVLIAFLPGVQLDCHIPGQFLSSQLIKLHHLFRCDGP